MHFVHLFPLIGLVFLPQFKVVAETLRVAPGHTVHLGCGVSYHIETTWIKHAADHNQVIVLTAHVGNGGEPVVTRSASPGLGADVINRSIALRIAGVSQPDYGLYYCVGKDRDALHFGKAILLQGLEPKPNPESPVLEDSEQATQTPPGHPLSFCYFYAATLGSGLLAMISAVITVHLKTRRRPTH